MEAAESSSYLRKIREESIALNRFLEYPLLIVSNEWHLMNNVIRHVIRDKNNSTKLFKPIVGSIESISGNI